MSSESKSLCHDDYMRVHVWSRWPTCSNSFIIKSRRRGPRRRIDRNKRSTAVLGSHSAADVRTDAVMHVASVVRTHLDVSSYKRVKSRFVKLTCQLTNHILNIRILQSIEVQNTKRKRVFQPHIKRYCKPFHEWHH